LKQKFEIFATVFWQVRQYGFQVPAGALRYVDALRI